MIILIILLVKSTAFCQVTETKQVKVSVLKDIAKDLEKCKLVTKAYETTSFNFDSILTMNVKLFEDLEKQQEERIELENSLRELNKEYNLMMKQKKTSWVVPGLSGVVIGAIVMGLIL